MKQVLAIFFSTLLVQACAQNNDYHKEMQDLLKGTVPIMKAPTLDSLKSTGSNIVLLDVRQQKEYNVSHIKGAQFIEYDEFTKKDVKDIPKNAKVVVYCTAGYRSERIGEKLQKLGFENVSNLYGGILDWKNNNYEVLNNQLVPTDSVHTYSKGWSKWLYEGVKVYD